MNYEIKQIDQIKRQLTVKVDPETYNKDYKKALEKFVKNIAIPGFRKGKAPLATVKKYYESQIKKSYLDDYMSKYYSMGIQETEAKPIGKGNITEVNTNDDEGGAVFIYEFETMPENFDYEYKNLEIEYKAEEYTEEMLDEVIKKLLEDNAEEVKTEGDKDPENTKKIIPELNDDTAKILGYDSVENLKTSLKNNILLDLENKNKQILQQAIVNAFGELNSKNIQIPEEYKKSYSKRILMQHFGNNIEMLQRFSDSMLLDLANKYLPNIIWDLAHEKIAEDHNITVTDEQVEDAIEEYSKHFNISKEDFKTKYVSNMDIIKNELLAKNVIDFLDANRNIVEEKPKIKRGRPKKST